MAPATTSSKPTVVIVPGSFSLPDLYTILIEQIAKQGYNVVFVDIPSIGRRGRANPATMYDDAMYVKSFTTKLADEGKDIVLVMHSYGGVVGTESAKGLAKTDRDAAGKLGGIINLCYITAIALQVGQSVSTFNSGRSSTATHNDDGYMTLDIVAAAPAIFSDVPYNEAQILGANLSEHSTASFETELTYAAYRDIPVSYLLCEEDKIILPESQRRMIQTMKDAGGNVTVYTCSAGHCPTVTRVEKVVEVVRRAAREHFEDALDLGPAGLADPLVI